MSTDAASRITRTSRLQGAVMVLAAVLAAFALAAPSAQAKAPKRVVAISPFAAAAMVNMGVKPIRIGQTIGGADRLPAQLRNVPKITLSHPNGPNLEVMAKLKPDLVFTSKQWSKGTAGMRRLGIRVVVADPLSPNQVKPSVTRIGNILGRQKQARKLNAKITRQISLAVKPKQTHPRVLVVLGVGRTPMAFLKNSWGGKLVQLAGGALLTGGATSDSGFARLSDEVVVAQNPDVIIVVPHGSSQDLGEVAEYIQNNDAWQTTNAAQDGRIYVQTQNELLQAGVDIGAVIKKIRREWLKNYG